MDKYNVCENFTLRCYRVRETPKMFILKCTINRKRNDSEEFTAPIYIDVNCIKGKCEGLESTLGKNIDRYEHQTVRVNGTFMPTEYEGKDKEVTPAQRLWADKIWLADVSDGAEYNHCIDWIAYCHEQKTTESALTLNCTMNSKKREGGYTKPIKIFIVCPVDSCNIEKDAYSESVIRFTGRFLPDDYIDKDGNAKSVMKIFAESVVKNRHK